MAATGPSAPLCSRRSLSSPAPVAPLEHPLPSVPRVQRRELLGGAIGGGAAEPSRLQPALRGTQTGGALLARARRTWSGTCDDDSALSPDEHRDPRGLARERLRLGVDGPVPGHMDGGSASSPAEHRDPRGSGPPRRGGCFGSDLCGCISSPAALCRGAATECSIAWRRRAASHHRCTAALSLISLFSG